MNTFLILEAGNLTIAAFFIAIALIVATRPFVSKGFKKGLLITTVLVFSLLIMGHYLLTSSRMQAVKTAFNAGEKVVCENRMHRKAAQGLLISKDTNWTLEGDLFVNALYTRPFHAARCIVKIKPHIELDVVK